MRKLKQLFPFLLFLYLPAQVMAWGQLGHRVVGEIATQFLTKNSKKEIQNILGHESLAMSSNWGDFIKSDPKFNYLYNWHFVNFPAGLNQDQFYTYLKNDTITDAYTKIRLMEAKLKDKSTPHAERQLYLRMLVHIVGDIHQPMHTGHKEDLGGNKIEVTWFGERSNLHRVWDDQLISSQELSYTEYSTYLLNIAKDKPRPSDKGNLEDWLYKSYMIGDRLYGNVKTGDKLGYKYIYENLAIANDQLFAGGVHLAQLLNRIFG